MQTLDSVVRSFGLPRPDFIKVDVEGFEKFVVEGAAKTIQQAKPVVVLELNHWCLNAFQRISVPEYFDYLRSVFPILLAIDGGSFADLHAQDQTYHVMYEHMVNSRYLDLVGAFEASRLNRFFDSYRAFGADPKPDQAFKSIPSRLRRLESTRSKKRTHARD